MIPIKTAICPKSKREFVPAPFNVYKIRAVDYCSYTCWMTARRSRQNASSYRSAPVVVHTVEGEFVGEYPMAKEAARALHLSPTGVYRCLHGKQSQTSGYVITYKE